MRQLTQRQATIAYVLAKGGIEGFRDCDRNDPISRYFHTLHGVSWRELTATIKKLETLAKRKDPE